MLEVATLFCLRVMNNPPLAFIAFGMLSSTAIHDAAHFDVAA